MLKGYSLQIRTRVQFRAVGFRLGCSSCFRNNFLDYESFVIEVEIVRRGLQEPAMQQAVCMSARGLQTDCLQPMLSWSFAASPTHPLASPPCSLRLRSLPFEHKWSPSPSTRRAWPSSETLQRRHRSGNRLLCHSLLSCVARFLA